MTPAKIKYELTEQAGSVTKAALAIKEPLHKVSHTINYYRLNDRIRRKLARRFGIRFDEHRPVRINELRRAA
jgi:hypothetical protein